MSFTTVLLVTTLLSLGVAIRVISTGEGKIQPRDGFAEILNSSLKDLDEFTLCGRFLTYQFTMPYVPWQVLLSIEGKTLLCGLVAVPCDHLWPTCTLLHRELIGDHWKYKKVFGCSSVGPSFPTFQSWQPGVWNWFCITASKPRDNVIILINGKTVVEADDDVTDVYHVSDKNIILMNSGHRTDDPEPSHGRMTDVNIWSRRLSQVEMADWSYCGTEMSGDVISWDTAQLTINKLSILEIPKEKVCAKKINEEHYIGFNFQIDFYDTEKFCRNIGGKVAVIRDLESLTEISKIFKECCDGGPDFLYSGFIKVQQRSDWVDVTTGETMPWTDWAADNPLSLPGLDCVLHNSSEAQPALINRMCSALTCPVCQLRSSGQNFILRGVCLDSAVDSTFVMQSSTEFLGYIQTKMTYSVTSNRWEIVNVTNRKLLAFMTAGPGNFHPIGRHHWHFLDTNCTDPGVEVRSLNLHLEVQQPGHFCCDDGTCVDSDMVCNNYHNCHDGADEANCTLLHLLHHQNDIGVPPVEFRRGKLRRLVLNGTLNVMKLFEIHDADSTFDLYFILEIVWFDKNLNFKFLKSYDNFLNEDMRQKIWIPKVEFGDIKTMLSDQKNQVIVLRRGNPTLDTDLDYVQQPNEVYTGGENPLKIILERRIRFSCSFDNIKNFPFGKQKCFLEFRVVGQANAMTTITLEVVRMERVLVVGEYVIEDWVVTNYHNNQTRRNMVRVTMILSRNIKSIFLVTYLPTILMNMINQATNYIKDEDKYSIIYTVNITCMMVLASIFLSVSASLPITSEIKPVESWLILNLAYPFTIILVNVVLQVRVIKK